MPNRTSGSQIQGSVFYNESKSDWWPKVPPSEILDDWFRFKDEVNATLGISQAALATILGLKAPNFANLLSGRVGRLRSERWTLMRERWRQFVRMGAICDLGFTSTKHSLINAMMQLDSYYQDSPATLDTRGQEVHESKGKRGAQQAEFAYLAKHKPGDVDDRQFDQIWTDLLVKAGINQFALVASDYTNNMVFTPTQLIHRWCNVDENFTAFLKELE